MTQVEEDKVVGKTTRQFPDFFKVKIVAGIALLSMLIIVIYSYFSKKIYYIEYIVPVLVFGYMMYYANFMKKHRETATYGEKLETIEKTGFATFAKLKALNVATYVIGSIILTIFLIYFFQR